MSASVMTLFLLLFTSFSWHILRPLMSKCYKYTKWLVSSIAFKLSYTVYIKYIVPKLYFNLKVQIVTFSSI